MTVTATELWQLGAVELAATIRSREASCRQVVDAHLRRIEEVNPAVNAVVVVLGEEARQAADAADAADRAVTAGEELPRLHGVPFTPIDPQ
jgi:amidase